jgi:hypothetical protein
MAPECSGLPAGARGKQVHSDLKADTHAGSQRTRQKCSVTTEDPPGKTAGVNDHDFLELLELQRLTSELLDHLTAMFPLEEAAELLRAMADGLESWRIHVATN